MASFGESLRKERELRGVSLREIADATKISVRFLDALESDRLSILPGGIFRRAFVRQYANHLGLDPDRLVADFLHAHPSERVVEPQPLRQEPKERAHPGTALLLTLVAAGVVLSVLKLGGNGAPVRSEISAPPPGPSVAHAADPVYPPPSSPRPTPVPAPDVLQVTVNATQACWVEARVDGQMVLNRVLTQGESHTLQAEGEILLSVGNAGGLRLGVNEREGLPLGDSGEVRRNIRITKKNLTSFLEDPAAVLASQSS